MTRRTLAAGLGLAALACLAHLPEVGGGFLWDDDHYLTANPLISDPEGAWRIVSRPFESPQYYPLVFLGFRLEYRLWGLDPAGYHAVNIALHAAGAVMAWRLGAAILPRGGWLAAALWAVHPVQVESVAWITERKNVLSACFYLAAWLAYRRARPRGEGEPGVRPGAWLAAFLLYLAALASKTVACSLPAAILVVAWWRRGTVGRADVVPLLPFFVAGLAAGLGTGYLEKAHVGARGPEWAIPMLDRALIAGRALWFYAGKLAWPRPLCFIYPRWHVDPSAWWQDAFPLAAVALAAALWAARGRVGRGPLAGACFFAGTLLPALGFFDVYPMRYSFVADHFQYLACLGLLAPAAVAIDRARGGLDLRLPGAGSTLVGVLLAILVGLTLARGTSFRDPATLWRDTLAKNPGCWMAHNNLGLVEAKRGRLEESKAEFLAATRISPGQPNPHFNLGSVHERLGQLGPARRHLLEALRLDPGNWETHLLLATVARRRGDAGEAAARFREAIRLCPGDDRAKRALERSLPAPP